MIKNSLRDTANKLTCAPPEMWQSLNYADSFGVCAPGWQNIMRQFLLPWDLSTGVHVEVCYLPKKRTLVKNIRTVVTATVNHLDMTEILLKTGYWAQNKQIQFTFQTVEQCPQPSGFLSQVFFFAFPPYICKKSLTYCI